MRFCGFNHNVWLAVITASSYQLGTTGNFVHKWSRPCPGALGLRCLVTGLRHGRRCSSNNSCTRHCQHCASRNIIHNVRSLNFRGFPQIARVGSRYVVSVDTPCQLDADLLSGQRSLRGSRRTLPQLVFVWELLSDPKIVVLLRPV
jgi:hypothetical protein